MDKVVNLRGKRFQGVYIPFAREARRKWAIAGGNDFRHIISEGKMDKWVI